MNCEGKDGKREAKRREEGGGKGEDDYLMRWCD